MDRRDRRRTREKRPRTVLNGRVAAARTRGRRPVARLRRPTLAPAPVERVRRELILTSYETPKGGSRDADTFSGMYSSDAEIRELIREHGRLTQDVGSLSRDSDLYAAGLTSHASVGVMLALEERFGVEFPEHLLAPSVFASIASIADALDEVGARRAAA